MTIDGASVCTTCGRTDLPPAVDWDPPICVECDAAINFDALVEAGTFDDTDDPDDTGDTEDR